ncbi:hypothetical protein [Aquimarina sp. 2304DJ70-9]|uniref:hypothetical protein n=1 Tax=Aquimarina penaris TaxID=3231044 RepID=UPI003461A3CC
MNVTQDISKKTNWNLLTLITFRFFFIYLIFNVLQKISYYIPAILGADDIYFFINKLNQLCFWVAKNILNIDQELQVTFNGSGDTTVNYIFQLITITITILATAIWSLLDFRRKEYNQLFISLRVLVRYFLVLTMFLYGFAKVLTLQFSELSNFDLIKTFGDSSPMGLLWGFMEYSNTYTRFSGIVEIFAGILLLFRKTVVLGALLLIAIMLNVFMMNISYDIPVKLYSIILFIMGIFILVPDIKRTMQFFVLNKTVQPKAIKPYFSKQKFKTAAVIIKSLVACFLLFSSINFFIKRQQKRDQKAPKPLLYGIYEVEEFIKNKDTLLPLTTDTIRWKRLIIDKQHSGVQTMDEKITHFKEETDTVSKTLSLISFKDSTNIQNLSYRLKDGLYVFESIYKSDTLKIEAKKKEREEFLLINRGFHWITERPFNK